MKQFQQWLIDKKQQSDNIISLYHSLLSKDFYAYILYRLRYFSQLSLIVTAVHCIEFYLLFFLLNINLAINILFYRVFVMVLNGSAWGLLERLREQIRFYHRSHKIEKIKTLIAQWMIGAALAAAVILCFAFYHLLMLTSVTDSNEFLFHCYSGALLFLSACQLLVRTLHSSLFALRRISRPFFSIAADTVVALILMIGTYPILKNYTLAFVYFASGILTLGLNIYYLFRMNTALGILPDHWRYFKIDLSSLKRTKFSLLILPALSGIALNIQAAIIFLLLEQNSHHQQYNLIMAFYLFVPQIQYNFSWAGFFYFDIKRLQSKADSLLSKKFHQKLVWVAITIALALWLMSVVTGKIFFGEAIYPLLISLLPLYITRSILSYEQMRCFCQHRYLDVIAIGGFLILSVWLLNSSLLTFPLNLIASVGVLGLSLLYSRYVHTRVFEDESLKSNILPYFEWLAKV